MVCAGAREDRSKGAPREGLIASKVARMMRGMRTVIYPGSFDPLTNGHVEVDDEVRACALHTVTDYEMVIPLFGLDRRRGGRGGFFLSDDGGRTRDFARSENSALFQFL